MSTKQSIPATPMDPVVNPTLPLVDTDNVKVGEEINGTFCKVYLVKDLKVDSFTNEVTGIAISGQQDASISRSKEVREIFHKDCNGNAKKSGGKNSWSISMSGMVIFGDAGLEMIEEIYDGNGKCGLYVEIGSRRYFGEGILVQNDMALPNDSEVTYDINVEGTGKLHKIDAKTTINLSAPK